MLQLSMKNTWRSAHRQISCHSEHDFSAVALLSPYNKPCHVASKKEESREKFHFDFDYYIKLLKIIVAERL